MTRTRVKSSGIQNVSATDKLLGRSTAGAGVIEEIACTTAGRALLDDADAATQRATLGLAIGTNVQAYDATLAGLASLNAVADRLIYATGPDIFGTATFTTYGREIVAVADASAARSTLGLVIGTNVQAYDAGLLSIAAATTAADSFLYTTALDVYAVGTITTFGRSLVDDADASTARTTLGLGTLATQSGTFSGTSSGTNTGDQTATSLGLVIGTNVQAYDAGLLSIAAAVTAADKFLYTTALDVYAVGTITTFGRSLVDDADASTARATLGLVIGTDVAPVASPTFSGTVGIGNIATNIGLYNAKTVTGGVNAYGYLHQGYVQLDVTGAAALHQVQLNTVANCNLTQVLHYTCGAGTIGAGLTLSYQFGYNVGPLDQATNNIGFNSAINTSATGKNNWAIYCSGNAPSAHIGKFGIGAQPTAAGAVLQVTGNTIQLSTARTPASASATGNVGEICWDASYLYVCTATNTWKRSLISTW